jgi:cell division protein FtsZ
MGGGTGTGAIPVVAEAARSAGALTVGVVTLPFRWEGARKMRTAEQGVQALMEQVDTLFVIPNDNLRKVTDQKASLANAFAVSDEVLIRAVGGIADLLRSTGFINLDFADLKTILHSSGLAHLGIGEASGKNKVAEAAAAVIHSDLMDTDIHGARRLIVNVISSTDLPMEDVMAVMEHVQEAAHEDANIIFGLGFDEQLMDALRLIVIATDFGEQTAAAEPARQEAAVVAEKQRTAPPPAEKKEVKQDAEEEWDKIWKKFYEK